MKAFGISVQLVKRPGQGRNLWEVIYRRGKPDERSLGFIRKDDLWAQGSPTRVVRWSSIPHGFHINQRHDTKQKAVGTVVKAYKTDKARWKRMGLKV